MPKYYRFRATSPTRRLKRCRDKEQERELENGCHLDYWAGTLARFPIRLFIFTTRCMIFKSNAELNSWLDVTLACTPAPNWYMRRTAWRESPPLMGVPRQLAAGLRASVQLANRPIFVFKIPSVRSQDWLSLL